MATLEHRWYVIAAMQRISIKQQIQITLQSIFQQNAAFVIQHFQAGSRRLSQRTIIITFLLVRIFPLPAIVPPVTRETILTHPTLALVATLPTTTKPPIHHMQPPIFLPPVQIVIHKMHGLLLPGTMMASTSPFIPENIRIIGIHVLIAIQTLEITGNSPVLLHVIPREQ